MCVGGGGGFSTKKYLLYISEILWEMHIEDLT